MIIDTARLATDAGYWNEVAPEDATHALDIEKRLYWEKWEDGIIWFYRPGGWVKHNKITAALFERIPRPQSEWVDGVPGVGEVIEVKDYRHDWIVGEVIGIDRAEMLIVCRTEYGYSGYSVYRKIPTKAQRDREDWINRASKAAGFPECPATRKVCADIYDGLIESKGL